MKNDNLKLQPLAIALLGGLSIASSYAEEATPIKCESSTSANTYVGNCFVSSDPSDNPYSYTELYRESLDFLTDEGDINITHTLNDPNAVIKLGEIRKNKGGFSTFVMFDDLNNRKATINVNVENFKSITNEHVSADGISLTTNNVSRYIDNSNNIVSNLNLTGDSEREILLKATSNSRYAGRYSNTVGVHSYIRTNGTHRINVDAKNTTINIVNVGDTDNTLRLRGVLIQNAHQGNSAINFANGKIHIDASLTPTQTENENEVIGVGINAYDTSTYAKHQNSSINFNDGEIILSNAKTIQGLAANYDHRSKGNINISMNGGRLEINNGLTKVEGISATLSDIFTYESYYGPSTGGNNITIDQEGGEIVINNTTAPLVYGINAHNANNGKFVAVTQKGLITINNTKEVPYRINAGIRMYGSNLALNQSKYAQINISGTNHAGILLTTNSAVGVSNINLAGTINVADTAIYANNAAASITNINIKDSAKLYGKTLIKTLNFGTYHINVAPGAILGNAEASNTINYAGKSKIQLSNGNDNTLTLNNNSLDNIEKIESEGDRNSLILNSYQNLDLNSKINSNEWGRIVLNNGSYRVNDLEFAGEIKEDFKGKKGLFINNSNLSLTEANNSYSGFTLGTDVFNNGNIDLRGQDGKFNRLLVRGDYTGGGSIDLNVELNGDMDSYSDVLYIDKDAYGQTLVNLHSKGGSGALTKNGIGLIKFNSKSKVALGKEAFILANSLDIGAYEYNALEFDETATSGKGFYLKSRKTASTSGSDQRGDDSTVIDKDGNPVYLFRKGTAAYILNQQINAQALADLNAGLYQRSGEQRAETNYLNPNQSWVRLLNNQHELTAHNLGAKTTNFGVQVGYDFRTSHNHESGLRNRTGIYAAYNKVDSTLTDSYRKEFYIPGRIDTNLGSLALYHTATLGNSYLDIVGGLHFFHSDYEIINGGEQNAFGGNLSVEGGYNFALGNHFFVEPQVQLSYQGTRYAGFKDAVTAVKGYTHQSLRPRAGFRLGYHDLAGTNLWLHANLETELLKTAKLTIGQDVVSINRAAKTVYDLGLNGQVALSPTTVLYGSAQYQGSLDKATTLANGAKVKTTKLHGFGAEAGLRFTW